jgi:dTDP-4-dehydrorhamnose reductase
MNINVLILGGTGLVGSAFKRYYENYGGCNVYAPSRQELDLSREYFDIISYMKEHSIDRVICAAAYVGGIIANSNKLIFKVL